MKKIDEVLKETSELLGINNKLDEIQTMLCWNEVVGEEISKKTYPSTIKNETLIVLAASAVWAHHLVVNKNKILKSVNQKSPKKIRDLRIRVDSARFIDQDLDNIAGP